MACTPYFTYRLINRAGNYGKVPVVSILVGRGGSGVRRAGLDQRAG